MGVRVQVQTTRRNGIDQQFADGLVRGTNLAAERLLALSLEEVPMQDAILAGSGTVEPTTKPDEPAQVVYDTPYAARLHEHPEYNFSQAANPGAKGKYLEDPAVDNRKELGDIIRAEALRD